MLNNESHPNYNTQKLTSKLIINNEIKETISEIIRSKFERAHFYSSAHAAIEMANEYGLPDLAKELTNDFNLEREAYA